MATAKSRAFSPLVAQRRLPSTGSAAGPLQPAPGSRIVKRCGPGAIAFIHPRARREQIFRHSACPASAASCSAVAPCALRWPTARRGSITINHLDVSLQRSIMQQRGPGFSAMIQHNRTTSVCPRITASSSARDPSRLAPSEQRLCRQYDAGSAAPRRAVFPHRCPSRSSQRLRQAKRLPPGGVLCPPLVQCRFPVAGFRSFASAPLSSSSRTTASPFQQASASAVVPPRPAHPPPAPDAAAVHHACVSTIGGQMQRGGSRSETARRLAPRAASNSTIAGWLVITA